MTTIILIIIIYLGIALIRFIRVGRNTTMCYNESSSYPADAFDKALEGCAAGLYWPILFVVWLIELPFRK